MSEWLSNWWGCLDFDSRHIVVWLVVGLPLYILIVRKWGNSISSWFSRSWAGRLSGKIPHWVHPFIGMAGAVLVAFSLYLWISGLYGAIECAR